MEENIFNNIKRNAHKLEERPSSDAWARLEARLDAKDRTSVRGRQRQLPVFRLMSIAASVLLLVAVSFVVSQTMMNAKRATFASATPVKVEDLPSVKVESYTQSPEVAEFQRRVNANPRGVILEGDTQKRLVVLSENAKINAKRGIRADSI